jgi:hypothetical protein
MIAESNTGCIMINGSDIDQYKKCRYNIAPDCLGTTHKTLFHGHLCYNCYGFKRSENKRSESIRAKNDLEHEIEEIKSQVIHTSQLQKISEILNQAQMKYIVELIKISEEIKSHTIDISQIEQISEILNPAQMQSLTKLMKVSNNISQTNRKPKLKILNSM